MKRVKKYLLIYIIIILSVFISGCNSFLFSAEKESEQISNLTEENVLVNSDEIRTMTINLIENAQKAIFIELTAFNDQEILDLIIKKAHQGIKIKILLDQWQNVNSETLKRLKNENISVQYYPAQKGQYQRVRYMVVDYQTAVYYCQDWTDKSYNTFNFAIILTGSSVWTITKSFVNDWLYTTTISLDLPDEANFVEDYIIYTVNAGIKQQILSAINSAKSEIKIYAEQISDQETVEALIKAKERGCKITLILSSSAKESLTKTIKEFEENQIIVEYFSDYQDMVMGFNLGIFDKTKLIITSSSWTYYSFVVNHESALIIPSPSVIEKIEKTIQERL